MPWFGLLAQYNILIIWGPLITKVRFRAARDQHCDAGESLTTTDIQSFSHPSFIIMHSPCSLISLWFILQGFMQNIPGRWVMTATVAIVQM